jgi:hypothetical protein
MWQKRPWKMLQMNWKDTSVALDGQRRQRWQRQGYSCLNGVVTAISVPNGKVIDVEVMSKYCNVCACHQHISKTDPEKYERLVAEHNCQLNHQGSTPAMEMQGA